jgi:ADP-heptose:LPS heptosyltransferase
MPKIYLSPDEDKLVKELQSEPYICINPFAGAAERLTLDHQHFKCLIDRIIDELGIKVILLGGNWKITSVYSTFSNRLEDYMTEEFEYERDRLVNLVGKASIRTATALSISCSGFIGNYTGTTHPSWIYQIKTYCCVSSAVGKMGPHDLAPYTWDAWPLMWGLPFSRMAILDENTTQDNIVQDIVQWFSKE